MAIVLTAALTLIGGVILFILSEFVRILVVIPLQKYNEQVQLTLNILDFYSNRLCNHFSAKPDAEEQKLIDTIKDKLRSGATRINSKYNSISLRHILVWLKLIPSGEKIQEVYGALIYLHNSILYEGEVDEYNNTSENRQKIEIVKNSLLTK